MIFIYSENGNDKPFEELEVEIFDIFYATFWFFIFLTIIFSVSVTSSIIFII